MKCFIVEGTLKMEQVEENTMNEHKAYSQKAMDAGLIVMSGLKSDMSGGLFIMKADSIAQVEEYLSAEPFKVAGIQEYRVIEYMPHYINQSPSDWFDMK
ncbi:Uncharacterized conserved protein YciI, contains a putative active-site phosphohistidine [Anaerosporobacter mobilis DSM 15930]|jgi:uncharacterized protein YciI|uniref:Uncharacterized conserved protein YciI, contains a putative active-site phosphohistidine n=1 Tax=Anaerosporobacter mobilis DSM 15930 TaxID=1120996 RepID=A0A1M7MH65_9FIRM|nr:YciI family protein [Anaerosporobacter mobilis]SHM90150.1 Uncharacterized conserved protein YciI, contains a putative active-site phosphohistidine [Anaerosporobacter mobilis DSM 15930]